MKELNAETIELNREEAKELLDLLNREEQTEGLYPLEHDIQIKLDKFINPRIEVVE